jgi:anti-sigma factor RsiW
MKLTGHLGEAISAYLDGELDSAERRGAESHVAGCEICREELDEMMLIRARLRSLPMRELPHDLQATTDRVRPIYRRPRFVASAAAAVVTLLAIATLAAPQDAVFAISDGELQATYGARATLDETFGIRSISPAQLVTDDAQIGGG